MRRVLYVAIAIVLGPDVAQAQLTYLEPSSQPTVGLELARTFLDDGGALAWYTSTVRARALVPVSASAHLFADWGVSIGGADDGVDMTFANPEVGIGFGSSESATTGRLTAVLPLGFGIGDDDLSALTGFLSDGFWPERYLDDLISVSGAVTPRIALNESATFVSDIQLSALIPTNEGDTELISRYAFGFTVDPRRVRVRGALEGLALLSGDDLSFSERTLHRIVLAVEGIEGGPGIFVRIPIDDQLDGADATVGLTFTF